jgi:hypothetical protein
MSVVSWPRCLLCQIPQTGDFASAVEAEDHVSGRFHRRAEQVDGEREERRRHQQREERKQLGSVMVDQQLGSVMVDQSLLSEGVRFKFHHRDCDLVEQWSRLKGDTEYTLIKRCTANRLNLYGPIAGDCCWEHFLAEEGAHIDVLRAEIAKLSCKLQVSNDENDTIVKDLVTAQEKVATLELDIVSLRDSLVIAVSKQYSN